MEIIKKITLFLVHDEKTNEADVCKKCIINDCNNADEIFKSHCLINGHSYWISWGGLNKNKKEGE
jgi:hypothetical protein